jgi:hypothetical protein
MPEDADVANALEAKGLVEEDFVDVVPKHDVTDDRQHNRCEREQDPSRRVSSLRDDSHHRPVIDEDDADENQ